MLTYSPLLVMPFRMEAKQGKRRKKGMRLQGTNYIVDGVDVEQGVERNKAAARHSWARQHTWLLLSFSPFPMRHPLHPPCTSFALGLHRILRMTSLFFSLFNTASIFGLISCNSRLFSGQWARRAMLYVAGLSRPMGVVASCGRGFCAVSIRLRSHKLTCQHLCNEPESCTVEIRYCDYGVGQKVSFVFETLRQCAASRSACP